MPHSSRIGIRIGALAALAATATASAAPAARSFDVVAYTAPDGFTIDDSRADRVSLAVGTKATA
jgi:hypothetical protein